MTKGQNQVLTYKWLATQGFETDSASCYNWKAKRDKDLFGFVDLVGVNGQEFWLCQATAWGSTSARYKKILGNINARLCVTVPGLRIMIFGWRRNKKTQEIELKLREVTIEDFKREGSARAKQPRKGKRAGSRTRSRPERSQAR